MIHSNITLHPAGSYLKKSGPEISIGDTLVIDGENIEITDKARCRPHPLGNAWAIPMANGRFLAVSEVLK